MLTLDEFYANWNGQTQISFDGVPANNAQCVQLVEYYIVQVCGLQPFWGNAIDWWNKFGGSLSSYYTKITYGTTTSYPKRGDVVIWNGDLPNSLGYGHIDICVQDGTPRGFAGFDTNWGGKYAHLVQHDYQYIIGWLTPQGANVDNVTITKEEQADYEYWKAIGQQLSYTKAWAAIGGDWKQVQPVIADLENYGDFVKTSQAWNDNAGDLTKLEVVAKTSATVLAPGLYQVQ